MRILIVSAILEPDAGGPATYVPRLARKLVERGWEVSVITYSDKPSYDFDREYPFHVVRIVRKGTILNAVRMFFKLLMEARRFDLIFSFDWYGVGLPLSVAALLTRTPYMVRVGGDYAWDQKYIESSAEPLPMRVFYERGLHLSHGYKTIFHIVRFVLSQAKHVVFNTDIERELYLRYYGLSGTDVSTIYNPVPNVPEGIRREAANNEIVFIGRFVGMKNIDVLLRAFARAKLPADFRLILIGDGPRKPEIERRILELGIAALTDLLPPMRQKEMFERIRNCRALVLPSWTDISPNNVYEALALKLPTIVTKEYYLSIHDQLPEMIDPFSEEDVTAKLEMLADPERYARFSEAFNSIRFEHSWDDAVRQYEEVFSNVLQ